MAAGKQIKIAVQGDLTRVDLLTCTIVEPSARGPVTTLASSPSPGSTAFQELAQALSGFGIVRSMPDTRLPERGPAFRIYLLLSGS
jgi:hypothetical protein